MSNDDKDLPPPLVPPDCDLRDFHYYGMEMGRLFGSSFHARATDSEWRAGITLWLKSYHQVPAGSLPNDDVELTRLAELGRDVKRFRKLKKMALHGCILCSDGRLYHKVTAEKALESFIQKLNQRKSSAAGNAKRHQLGFAPEQYDSKIFEATEMLRALNSNSRFLTTTARKPFRSNTDERSKTSDNNDFDVPPGDEQEANGIPGSVPFASQGTGQEGIGQEYKNSDAAHRPGVPPVAARDVVNIQRQGSFLAAQAPLPPDVRTVLFREGLQTLITITGRSESSLRSYLSKALKELKDDAAIMLAIIRDCAAMERADPLGWITKAVKERAMPKSTLQERLQKAAGLSAPSGIATIIIDHEDFEDAHEQTNRLV